MPAAAADSWKRRLSCRVVRCCPCRRPGNNQRSPIGTPASKRFRQAAGYVHKLLRGADAIELSVQQPTKFELVISLKAAKALGLEIPSTLLALADEVIE
jgi:hypothetical protein